MSDVSPFNPQPSDFGPFNLTAGFPTNLGVWVDAAPGGANPINPGHMSLYVAAGVAALALFIALAGKK